MTLSEPSYDGAGGDVGHVARYVFITMFTECHAMFYSYLRIKKKKIHQLSKMTYQKSARAREREREREGATIDTLPTQIWELDCN